MAVERGQAARERLALSVQDRKRAQAAFAAQGFDVVSGTPEQFANHIKSEIARMTKIAAAANIKAD